VTPRRTLFAAEVVSFSAPGVVGGFQVLVNHAPLLAALETGEVKLVEPGGAETRFADERRFCRSTQQYGGSAGRNCRASDEIDIARARAARERAQARLSQRAQDVDLERARASLRPGVNRLKIAGFR